MSNDNTETVAMILAGIIIAVGAYLFIALLVGTVNAQSQMNWCEWKNGQQYMENGDDGVPTNKRWSPNPFTVGLTGKCINPGDKGL